MTTAAWNTLLNAHAQRGDEAGARGVLERMTGGAAPDRYTYATLVKLYSRLGRLDDAQRVLQQAAAAGKADTVGVRLEVAVRRQRRGSLRTFLPWREQLCQVLYTAVCQMFGNAGRYDDAWATFDGMSAAGVPRDTILYTYMISLSGKVRAVAPSCTPHGRRL